MQARVYFNLHKKCFSIQHKINGRWVLHSHAREVDLINVSFKVYEKGRQRVLREKAKNVHAFVLGWVDPHPFHASQMSLANYNPYKAGDFTNAVTGEPVRAAAYATLSMDDLKGKIYYIPNPIDENPFHHESPEGREWDRTH
jgi:glycosyltransferase involved in cell wall biosynthesis